MLLRYVFFLTTTSLFAQSFFHLEENFIYIIPETPNDIHDIDVQCIKPYIYTSIPDLSGLDPVNRKHKFINMILPSILIEKEKIKHVYNYVLNNLGNLPFNDNTAVIYDYCNCTKESELLLCLYNQPNSIILAQAAIESGWGTSRFFLEGFNLFGIHTYNKHDDRIQAHASLSSQPVYVKKYNSILSSISHYLRTLAKGDAYIEFRKKRGEPIDVENMIIYLTKYSERRELYIQDIKSIIDYNNLTKYDNLQINWK